MVTTPLGNNNFRFETEVVRGVMRAVKADPFKYGWSPSSFDWSGNGCVFNSLLKEVLDAKNDRERVHWFWLLDLLR